MQDKIIVITGATSGIGEVAALSLAAQGARIVAVARDKARGRATLAKLRQAGPGQAHSVHYADLSLISDTKRVGAEIAAAEPRIDVLLNNAGAVFNSRHMTKEGLELTFALNHMAYFVLTEYLRDNLAPGARIVNTASSAHQAGKLDLDDLQSEKKYSGFSVYGTAKLCNILFTRELARQLAGSGITANCFHPGLVATRFADEAGGFLFALFSKVLKRVVSISPEDGAKTLIYLASSPEVEGVTGQYFYKCRAVEPKKKATDDVAAKRLWTESLKLAGIPAEAAKH